MAYLCVDNDGTELMFKSEPHRHSGFWEDNYYKLRDNEGEYYEDSSIELPKGTIYKIIGQNLTWLDEPIQLKELL